MLSANAFLEWGEMVISLEEKNIYTYMDIIIYSDSINIS